MGFAIFSAILVAAVTRGFASSQGKSAGAFLRALVCAGLVSIFLGPTLLFQCFALLVVGFVCFLLKAKPRYFFAAATLTVFAVFLTLGIEGPLKSAELRRKYPLESLAGRLAYEEGRRSAGLDSAEVTQLGAVYAARMTPAADLRAKALAMIHASFVEQFMAAPGFGMGRMPRLAPWLVVDFPQPGPVSMATDDPPSAVDLTQPEVAAPRSFELAEMHLHAQVDFANEYGFGYFRDLEHVAGFVPHRFSRSPDPFNGRKALQDVRQYGSWTTRKVELVSLLKHEQPLVYLSQHLPRMDELRDAPTRPLDAFEAENLPALQAGENLCSAETGGRIRMLGAIRAARQCLTCHAVEHGALLGAFSYELGFRPPENPVPAVTKVAAP